MSTFKKLGFLDDNGGVLRVNPGRLKIDRHGDRPVSIASHPAISPARASEARQVSAGQ